MNLNELIERLADHPILSALSVAQVEALSHIVTDVTPDLMTHKGRVNFARSLQEVKDWANGGRLIFAIKALREASWGLPNPEGRDSMSLAHAKWAVECAYREHTCGSFHTEREHAD